MYTEPDESEGQKEGRQARLAVLNKNYSQLKQHQTSKLTNDHSTFLAKLLKDDSDSSASRKIQNIMKQQNQRNHFHRQNKTEIMVHEHSTQDLKNMRVNRIDLQKH